MLDQSILPQWLIDQQRAMDARLFEQNLRLANSHCWLALHGPHAERKANKRLAEHYVERALAFADGGPRA